MKTQKITLSLDLEIFAQFKQLAEDQNIPVSSWINILMKEQIYKNQIYKKQQIYKQQQKQQQEIAACLELVAELSAKDIDIPVIKSIIESIYSETVVETILNAITE